jgi:hypothetical protein
LARIAYSLGFRRLGILSVVEQTSLSMMEGVTRACGDLGIVVAESVAGPTGINTSSSDGQATIRALSNEISTKFGAGKNVKVFVLAVTAINDAYVNPLLFVNRDAFVNIALRCV